MSDGSLASNSTFIKARQMPNKERKPNLQS